MGGRTRSHSHAVAPAALKLLETDTPLGSVLRDGDSPSGKPLLLRLETGEKGPTSSGLDKLRESVAASRTSCHLLDVRLEPAQQEAVDAVARLVASRWPSLCLVPPKLASTVLKGDGSRVMLAHSAYPGITGSHVTPVRCRRMRRCASC